MSIDDPGVAPSTTGQSTSYEYVYVLVALVLSTCCLILQHQHTCHLIEAWQQYFLVMVGKDFTGIFEEDRQPPLLSHLLQKSASLLDKLESFPELPDARIEGTKVNNIHSIAGFTVVIVYIYIYFIFYAVFEVVCPSK